ncbi:MAG: sialidase family protein [Acidimicrobiales bacterium]
MVAASVVGIVAATPGVALAASTGGAVTFAAQAVKISRLTAPVQMTKDDPVPSRGFSGPFMLADPANPRIIVAATAELRTRVCYLLRSTDAGVTWHILPALPALGSYPFCTTPNGGITQAPLAWGRNNTLYYALNGYSNADGGDSRQANYSVQLARSTNLGNSWSTTLVDNNRGRTGTAVTNDTVTGLAVDTSGPQDVVYVAFGQAHPKAPKTSPQANPGSMVAVSTDGGSNFRTAIDLNQFSHVSAVLNGKSYPLRIGRPILSVGRGGVVLATAPGGTAAGTTIPGPRPPVPLLVARSTDQGRTWSLATLSPPVTSYGGPTGFAWTPKGGAQGTFLVTDAVRPTGETGASNVEMMRSTDGGQTWSAPLRLNNDNPSKQFVHFLPEVGVAPNGRVDVAWYDFRRQHGFSPDVYYTYSTDAGVTWAPNVRITDRPINFSIGITNNVDVRQPVGVASANPYAAVGWVDTRLGNTTTQTQDDFGAVAQFAPLPASSSSVLPVLAAIFGGLVVAGLILILILVSRRRREGPTPPRVEQRQPVGAG